MQKEIFNKLVDERLKKITDLDKRVNNNDLIIDTRVMIQILLNLIILLISLIRYEMVKKELITVKNNQYRFKSL